MISVHLGGASLKYFSNKKSSWICVGFLEEKCCVNNNDVFNSCAILVKSMHICGSSSDQENNSY